MAAPRYPLLFQINTRVRLSELADAAGRPATLDDITDAELDELAAGGFDLVWFLGVWQTGAIARSVSLSNPDFLAEYERVLPGFTEADVTGSCFAVCDYHVHADFGGDAALARLRARLQERGLRLILDFVPNHMAPDHRWVKEHPDYFIEGTPEKLADEPRNYRRFDAEGEGRILAYGRDPYFAGWPDTVQLNYANPALQAAMRGELERIAGQCDGVRCDMAMLILPEVFERTWGVASAPFWPETTAAVHARHPGFIFLAEVYWDLEWTLQRQGFDYTYDKRLYDRLVQGQARPVREHFYAGLDYQDHMARFLENHDEPRAAATFAPGMHQAAAIITFLSPGMRFLHQGQLVGKKVRIPTHLGRGPVEAVNAPTLAFYERLIECLKDPAYRAGEWQLLHARPAWEGNDSDDAFVIFAWSGPDDLRRLVAVNYAQHSSQCYVEFAWDDLAGRAWRLQDTMGEAVYDRDGGQLAQQGLFLDLPAWGYHVFAVTQQI